MSGTVVLLSPGLFSCGVVVDSPAVLHPIATAAMASLRSHYIYLRYMTDCHSAYDILLECCCSVCTLVQHSYLNYSWCC